jgi:hypothetical protein
VPDNGHVSETPTPEIPPKKRPRHLMDPDNPRREVVSRSSTSGTLGLEPVQKWVLSVLAATTLAHLAGGLVIAAMYVDDDRVSARIGLNIVAAAFGVLGVLSFLAIQERKLLSPWLLLGLIPLVVGLYLTFR